MNYDQKDIDNLLENWYISKQELVSLEKKIEKYKKYAHMIMTDNDIVLSNSKYTLTKRDMSRTILSKDDVPRDIWCKYSKNISYPMFIVRKKK